MSDKIIISPAELQTRKVDNRLREQQAMARNRLYASLQEDALPVATPKRVSFWRSSAVVMTLFGLAGALLAWGAGLLLASILSHGGARSLGYDPGAKAEADALLNDLRNIKAAELAGRYTADQAQIALDQVSRAGRSNPYFLVSTDEGLSERARTLRRQHLEASDSRSAFIVNVLTYGICGMMIAACLAIAEPLAQRKFRAAALAGLTGAALGLLGGVAAALLSGRISVVTTEATVHESQWVRQLASGAAIWAALGLFLALASGLVMRNGKRLMIGLAGGLVGGAVGGALIYPLQDLAHHPQAARLAALLAIGVVAGAGTGLIENAAKSGWLKVTTGIIAGKQFILYRNPTYIGSSPDCQIYLFKDPKVGKRHAAVHLTPSGIEIEDLPLGAATLVNGTPIERAPLKNGDRIAIGMTQFIFHEKRPTSRKGSL